MFVSPVTGPLHYTVREIRKNCINSSEPKFWVTGGKEGRYMTLNYVFWGGARNGDGPRRLTARARRVRELTRGNKDVEPSRRQFRIQYTSVTDWDIFRLLGVRRLERRTELILSS